MKKTTVQDERVVVQRRKINSEAYGLLLVALIASIFVQQFLLDAPFKQYGVEVICLVGISVYTAMRYMMLGLSIQAKALPVINSLAVGLIVTAINGVMNYTKYAEQYQNNIGYFIATLAITFFSATILVFAVLSLSGFLNKRNQARIQKKLDDEENAE